MDTTHTPTKDEVVQRIGDIVDQLESIHRYAAEYSPELAPFAFGIRVSGMALQATHDAMRESSQ